MSNIRIQAALNRSIELISEYNIQNDIHGRYEFRRKIIFSDKTLTNDEKNEALRFLNEDYDRDKIYNNDGPKRICENCNQECLATLYCEICVRNYLKANFTNWTSRNHDIDNLIQQYQMR